MKLLVPVKRVLDHNTRPRILADKSGIDFANARMAINPFDEIALEEAVRLKEKDIATEIIAVSVGRATSHDVLRTAMAIGADRSILVSLDADAVEPLAYAKLLAAIVRKEQPDLVLMGKQAIDDDMNAEGQMLAGLLGWSQATFASEITLETRRAVVTREVDGGQQVVAASLPAIVTADLRLNTPRIATLPNVMKAKKRPIEEISALLLGVDIAPRLTALSMVEPEPRKAGVQVGSVDELLEKLKNEAGILCAL